MSDELGTILESLRGFWGVVEPWVNGFASVAAILGLLYTAWLFVRTKIIPRTVFGYHVGLINASVTQLDEAITLGNRLEHHPSRIAAFIGMVLLHHVTIVGLMIFLGLVVTDPAMRVSLLVMLLSRLLIGTIAWTGQLRYLMNPFSFVEDNLASIGRRIDGALATGVKSDRLSKIRLRLGAIKDKIRAAKRPDPLPPSRESVS